MKNNLEIIIITYNRSKYLEKTLLQIKDSPISNYKITILNNCSTDNTLEICDKYKKYFKNFNIITNNKNIGGNANIARAFELATLDYVWVMCDDDNYDFSNWNKIEKEIDNNADVIFLTKFEDSEANRLYHSSGTYMCLYKTSNITSEALDLILNNIPNMFPHTALYIDILNKGGKIIHPQVTIVTAGQDNWGGETYLRGLKENDVSVYKKNMFWFIGYINTISLIKNKKTRNMIIDETHHCCSSFFELLIHKLWMNRTMYSNSFMNRRTIYYAIPLKWRLIYPFCYFLAFLKTLFNSHSKVPSCVEQWVEIFHSKNIIKKINKYKDNKVILYGAGMMTEALDRICPIENITCAVTDRKFNDELELYKNVKTIPLNMLINYINNDTKILVCVYRFGEIKKQLNQMGIKNKNIVNIL